MLITQNQSNLFNLFLLYIHPDRSPTDGIGCWQCSEGLMPRSLTNALSSSVDWSHLKHMLVIFLGMSNFPHFDIKKSLIKEFFICFSANMIAKNWGAEINLPLVEKFSGFQFCGKTVKSLLAKWSQWNPIFFRRFIIWVPKNSLIQCMGNPINKELIVFLGTKLFH